jgi:glycosyltransferase involved in cell wall biosynthesis
MSVFAISMFKDEEDVAEDVLSHFEAQGVAGIIVADNLSTDRTRERLEATAARLRKKRSIEISILDDREPGYYQSRKMTALAARAAASGATWIVPFDADELWHPADGSTLSTFLERVSRHHHIVHARLFNYLSSGRDDPAERSPFRRIQWRLEASGRLPKVAVRWHQSLVIQQGNHSATFKFAARAVPGLVVRHYPYRSFEHFMRKARNGKAAYDAAPDLPRDQGNHWRDYGQILEQGGEEALRAVWEKWFHHAEPERELVHDPYALPVQ